MTSSITVFYFSDMPINNYMTITITVFYFEAGVELNYNYNYHFHSPGITIDSILVREVMTFSLSATPKNMVEE